jgi:branched-chain amino acid transport system ATP-binding protein
MADSTKASLARVAHEPGVAKPDSVLTIDGIRRAFGGLTAVDVDHLEVERHTVTSLIGPNGAGKTTLFNLISGFDRPDDGEWHLNGGPLVGISAHQVARRGMVRTFQLTRSLARLTVLENMLVADQNNPGESLRGAVLGGWRAAETDAAIRANDLLSRFEIEGMADEYAGALSGGQRKLLEVARALMVDPEVIMLDEPMAGVNPALTQSLLGHIIDLRDHGKTVIFIEHDMDVVQEISDWVVVLAEGRVIAEGPPASIARNSAVVDAYLGAHHGEAAG